MNIAILCEKSKTLLHTIFDARYRLGYELKLVIATVEGEAVDLSRDTRVETIVLPKGSRSDGEYYAQVQKTLQEYDIDIVILCEYQLPLTNEFIEACSLISTYPALLPACENDDDPVQRAIERKAQITGVTSFVLSVKKNQGPIIMQEAYSLTKDETYDTLKQKLDELQQKLLLETLKAFTIGTVKIKNKQLLLNQTT